MDETNKNGDKEEQAQPEEKDNKLSEQEVEGESPVSELDKLRQQLETQEQETKTFQDRFLRQVAELENFKKRMTREKGETIRYANEGLVKDLLPGLDNLERAVEHGQGGENGQPVVEGIELVLKGLLEALGKHGVTQILAKGEKFDPEKHEAIAQVECREQEPNTVVEEHHKGYFLHDRLLRPALVSVAKALNTKEKKRDEGEVEKEEGDD